MGSGFDAICEKCGNNFTFNDGGGFLFHLLRCNKCGSEKTIKFDDIPDLHCRFVKGLDRPYSVASMMQDKEIQESYPGEPLSEKEYFKLVEKEAGRCRCGGNFKFKSKPRCPRCKSLKVKTEKINIIYD